MRMDQQGLRLTSLEFHSWAPGAVGHTVMQCQADLTSGRSLQQIKSRTKCKKGTEAGTALSEFGQDWMSKMENTFV